MDCSEHESTGPWFGQVASPIERVGILVGVHVGAVGEDDGVGENVVVDAVGEDDGVGALFGAAVGGAGHGVSGNP